jgi:hypothetical protein
MDENYYNLPGLFNSNPSPSFFQDLLNRLQISGNVENQISQGINSVYGGGRIGYEFPINNDALTLGLLGSGYKVSGETPYGSINQSKIGLNGLDALYQAGPSSYGVRYERQPQMGNMLNVFYNREF